jgi:hypothetical protein
MDINPLIMDEKAIVAVDARIVVDYPKPSTDPYHHLAIHPYPAHLVKKVQLNDGTDIVIRVEVFSLYELTAGTESGNAGSLYADRLSQ